MEAYKSGQGSFIRLSVNVALVLVMFLGAMELYSWWPEETEWFGIRINWDKSLIPIQVFQDLPLLGVPFSWRFLLCTGLGLGLWWLIHRAISKPARVDTLIETELELKKVSWPTGAEARNATWIVVLVTIILTASLAFFDIALVSIFKFFFETGGG